MTIYLIIGIIVTLFEAKFVMEYFEGEFYTRFIKTIYKVHKIGKVFATIIPAILAIEFVLIWPIVVMFNIIGPIVARRSLASKTIKIISKCENLANNILDNLDKDIDEYNEMINN